MSVDLISSILYLIFIVIVIFLVIRYIRMHKYCGYRMPLPIIMLHFGGAIFLPFVELVIIVIQSHYSGLLTDYCRREEEVLTY